MTKLSDLLRYITDSSSCHFFVTVDIKSCYDCIDSNIMLNIISQLFTKVSHSLIMCYHDLIITELISVQEYVNCTSTQY